MYLFRSLQTLTEIGTISDYEELLVEMKRYDDEVFDKGRKEGKTEMILKMQGNGLSLEKISKFTSLSIEELKKLLNG